MEFKMPNVLRFARFLALIGLLPLLLSCAAEEPVLDRVQTNLVDKQIFEGEWWYSSTAIDVSYDEAFIFGSAAAWAPFEGSMSTDYGLDFNRGGPYVLGAPFYSFPIGRIRWVIDEDHLFAFRTVELVTGGNDDGRSPGFRGQPLAVFAIEAHVDIRNGYNPVTGEENNVREENTQDRRWYERQFMRVDWSQNLITEYVANNVEANELFTNFTRSPTSFFVQEGSQEPFPEEYRPQFVRLEDEEGYRFAEEWPDDVPGDTVHYMSFVTQEVWSSGGGCLQSGGACSSASATMRNSFLRVPPDHQYALATSTHREFDRFGIFRSHQPSYARGGKDVSELRHYCRTDADCVSSGGACDTERNICAGGLTRDKGESDFLNFYASRLNFYAKSLTDQECVSDWECDGRYDSCEDGDEDCVSALQAREGSGCDSSARRCTIPLRDRPTRPVVYHLTPDFPPYLVRQAFETVAQWNETLMRGQRAVTGKVAAEEEVCDEGVCLARERDLQVDCQTDNPVDYCYCGSPEEERGSCKLVYDPFEAPEDARERGIPNPYDCYVEGPKDVRHPEDYGDYEPQEVYGYQFVGDECLLVLKVNSCNQEDDAACEQLGDLRYQFLSHVQHGGAPFAGVAQPLTDPHNGELVVSNATVAAQALENVGTRASQFFPVLRGDEPEDSYFTGENVRGYYARLGRVDHPVTTVPTGADGYTHIDSTRPTSSSAPEPDPLEDLAARAEELGPKLQQLFGQEGRAAIYQDRIAELEGSDLEQRLLASLEADGEPLLASGAQSLNQSALLTQSAIDGPMANLLDERRRRQEMAARNMDVVGDQLFNSQYWQYWADAFDGYSLDEASLRLQQAYFRSVMLHEIGHALGLRHNFAGSLDRDHYHDAYFKIARRVPLPYYFDYDGADLGGNEDGYVTGAEVQRWSEDLKEARERRLQAGAGNVMTSSLMDYNGDLSDFAGLGRYDRAAVLFNYFSLSEAYTVGDPTEPPEDLPAAAQDAGNLFTLHNADTHRRALWSYYRGGDRCSEHFDCPYSAGRETVAFQEVTQRCVTNPRDEGARRNCDGQSTCVCSNFYDDFDDYMAARAYRTSSRDPEFAPVTYRFCHDNRVNDLSWCSTFDAGESFQEIVEHYRQSWLQRYPQLYFRNFRRSGPSRGYANNTIVDAVKIYQHMLFRRYYENLDTRVLYPLSFRDQLYASADVLNWLGEILAAPDVGTYSLDADENVYRQVSREVDAGGDLSLGLGQGFYMWSEYQEGLNGFSRLERSGIFLDKIYALQAITRRDWGLNFTVDERYFINFYDMFPREVVDLLGGLILRNPRAYAPRVEFDSDGEPQLSYLSHYRSGVRQNNETVYTEPAVDGTDSEALRGLAAIEALATFPTYYDTSFEQQFLIFKLGSGDGYKIPETRRDGTPTCQYGDEDCEAPDYIVYDSDRLHSSYVAVTINPRGDVSSDEQQLGYQLLLRLTRMQDEVRALQALPDPTSEELRRLERLRLDLQRDEGFVEYMMELARRFGITNILF